MTTAEAMKSKALELLEGYGPEAVSMRRVASSIGVTPMAIYHHFKNRTALLDAVVAEEFAKLEQTFVTAKLVGATEDRLVQVLLAYVDYALTRPRIFDYLFAEPRAGARRFPDDFKAGQSPTLNRVAELVRSGMAAGELRTGDEWEIALDLWAHVHGFVMLYRAGRFDLAAPAFRTHVRGSIHRLLHGLATS